MNNEFSGVREGNAPPIDISGNYFRGVPEAGRRLALTDRGLSLLARRDHTSVGVAKRRWSITLEYPEGPFEWRNVTGRRGRQLLRNVEHTAAVHGFLAALSTQAPCGRLYRSYRGKSVSAGAPVSPVHTCLLLLLFPATGRAR